MNKQYLGDGVYVECVVRVPAATGTSLVLTVENGIHVTDTIVLEPGVFASLVRYAKSPRPHLDAYATHTQQREGDGL